MATREPGPGRASGAPYYATTGTRLAHLEPGFAVVEFRPGGDVTDAAGRLLPGVAAAVADAALGSAVYSLLPETLVSQTVELRIDALPGVAGRADWVAGRGTAVHVGAATTLSRGDIVDGAGNVRALATCRCVVLPVAEGEYRPLDWGGGTAQFLLEPPSSAPQHEHEVTSPADLDGFLATEFARRLDLELETVEEQAATMVIPASPGLANMYGNVHGGAVAVFCEVAIAVALHALLSPGTGFAVLDFALNFLRPVPVESRVTAGAEIVHGGRRFAVVRATLQNPDGRIAALASSTVYLEGR